MGFLKKAFNNLSPIGIAKQGFDALEGKDAGSAILSGIPFIGEGFAAQQQQQFASAQSLRQMQFQERMSNTAHQREVEDLKKAGLNPVLSANAGASSPVGASAAGSAMSGGGSSAKLLETVYRKERQKSQSQIDKNKADESLSKVAAEVKKEQKDVMSNTAKSINKDIQMKNHQEKMLQKDRDIHNLKRNLEMVDLMGSSANKLKNLFNPLSSSKKGRKKGRKTESYGPQGEHQGTKYDYDLY